MARKDSRGYALKKGESQRKDGRYVFRYTTIRGEQKAVYAKELSELRKKEVKIRRAIEDGLDPDRAERITLNELFDEYISQKYDLKQSTLTNYKYMYNHYVRVDFGKRRISKIKYTDVKKFYYSLIMEKGFKPNSMEIVNTLLHPTFTMAVRDGLLRLNPTEGVMTEIKKSHSWEKKKRHALTIPEQKAFTNYIANSEEYRGYWLIIHSGSRRLGVEVASFYQSEAFQQCPEGTPFELAYATESLMDDYLHDMKITQAFAELNRRAIANDIVKGMKLDVEETISTIHNYIDLDSMILRKGAVSAKAGEKLVIPMNMRDGCLICVGKGNPEWNESAPHGAGRLMSRADARNSFTLSQYKKEMKGIYTSSVDRNTLDESPMAYKPMETILRQIEPTVKIVERTKPIYNFKASEEISK